MVIQDDGQGMSQETLARMLDPFFSTKALGRGLGRATTLGTVRSQHGCLEVITSPGLGSRFTVYVIDDNEPVRRVHLQMLELPGFAGVLQLESLDTMTGDTASIDRAMIDLTVPGLPGIERVRQFLEKKPALPVILVSGYALPAGTPLPSNVALLQKPFTINGLAAVSERVMAAGKKVAGGALVNSAGRQPFG